MAKIIRITSTVPGFRRCGKAHPAHPVDYPDEEIPDEVLAALKAESRLVVQELELPDAGPNLELEDADGTNSSDVSGEPKEPEPSDDDKSAKAGKAKAESK